MALNPDESAASLVLLEADLVGRAIANANTLPASLLLDLAEHLRTAGDSTRATELLNFVESRDGLRAGILEVRARICYASGDHAGALQQLKSRAELRPSATASIAIARLSLDDGDVDAAREISNRLLASQPELLTVQALAGAIARADGDRKGARTFYLAMAELKSEHPGALLTLAELCIDDDDCHSAQAFFRRALTSIRESSHQSAALLEQAMNIAIRLGDTERAADLKRQKGEVIQTQAEAQRRTRIDVLQKVLAGDAPVRSSHNGNAAPARVPARGPAPVPAALETFNSPTTTDSATDPAVLQTLRDVFGHDALRPGQATIINQVMAGQDTLAVMPTGAGKSLTFQLPAMLRDGVTVVVSPLIALMKDQVDGLPDAVQVKTALINSTLSPEEMRTRLAELRRGQLKLIYVAPERLRQHGFLKTLRDTKIATLVIDEAHCISMWGHDFRPDYLFIPRALKEIGDPPVLAITATATQTTAKHIAEGLDRKLELVRTSVFRPNLFYLVEHCANRDEKISAMIDFCRVNQGSGIVYVSSRKDAEELAGLLRNRRISAGHYHAGMDPASRAAAQETFMSGHVRVVVATIAFGMGIDKSDVRFIVRFSPPSSLEAYAQESGRAGRDSRPAKCLLLIAKSDESTLKRFLKRDQIGIAELRRIYQAIRRQASGRWAILDIASLAGETGDEGPDPRIALGLLDQARLIRRHPDAAAALQIRFRPGVLDAPQLDPEQAEAFVRLKTWLGDDALANGGLTVQTAAACEATGIAPIELDRLLAEIPAFTIREMARGVCLELLPAGPDAGSTMQVLLEKAQQDAEFRIDRVVHFAAGGQCRHQALAAHLGESLAPCKTQCDVCTGTVAARPAHELKKTRKETPGDRLILLKALQTAPYSLGAPSLVKLVVGAAESKIQRDRSSYFGTLNELSKASIERLIESSIDEGLMERYEKEAYRMLAVTRAGAELIGVRYTSPFAGV